MEEVVNPYHDKCSRQRKGLLIKSPWNTCHESYVKNNNVKALYFNSARGWSGSDFSFLASLNGIEEINIICSKINNLSSIENIHSLQEISINGVVSEEIDFHKLQYLKKCYLFWWSGAKSILKCSSLENVYFDKFKLKSYEDLSKLSNVKSLTIANSPMPNLEWLNGFDNQLEEIYFLNCRKLENFSTLTGQSKLKRLAISGSKLLYELEFLSELKILEVLDLSDSCTLKTIIPLSYLKELKAFSFAGSKATIEDGDLSVLTTLPKLAMLMFAPRKHYTHKLIKKWDWNNFDNPDKLLEKI